MNEPIYFKISHGPGAPARSTLNELVEDVRKTWPRASGDRMAIAFKHAMMSAFAAGMEYQLDHPQQRPIDWDSITDLLELDRPDLQKVATK